MPIVDGAWYQCYIMISFRTIDLVYLNCSNVELSLWTVEIEAVDADCKHPLV